MPQMHVTEASRIQEFLLGALGLLDSAPKRLSFLRVILEIADQRNDGALDALESRSFLYGAVAALDPDAAASLARRHSPFGSARSYRTSPSLHPRRDRVGALKMASRDLLKLIANEAAKLPKQSRQPSQALRATTNGRDRNYSGQSARRKPLSGSPAASRKRSSTA